MWRNQNNKQAGRIKRKMACLKTLLIGLFFSFGINSYAQNYIPEASTSIKTSEVILAYSFEPGANRPSANFKFKDGVEINLNAVCEGDYSWFIRIYEDDKTIDLGSLKMEFHNNRNAIVLKTRIDNNKKYKKYLDLLAGKYRRVK
jgi:hypothetical protein